MEVNKQPTKEQLKKFYTKILDGQVEIGTVVNKELVCYRRTSWNEQDGEWNIEVIPRMDSLEYLGWLFKYAVPNLQDKGYQIDIVCYEHEGFSVGIFSVIREGEIFGDIKHNDLSLALFWTIWEVIDDGKD